MYKNTFFYVWYIVTVSLGLLGASVAQDFDPRFAASKSIQRRQVSEDASAEVDAASQDAGLAIVAPTDSFQAVIVE